MKNYVKGIITGILIAVFAAAIPVMADTADALFNQLRISVNGADEIQWGENLKLTNGESAPSSILYNGTTYLPMRKLGNLMGYKIYWNGDSSTVYMTDTNGSRYHFQTSKADKNGNEWQYYTFNTSDGRYYLEVKDEARNYERFYRIATESVNITDNEIYFARYNDSNNDIIEVVKMPFESDENSQDGEVIETIPHISGGGEAEFEIIFDKITNKFVTQEK